MSGNTVRIVFFGTPEFTIPVLERLLGGARNDWEIVGIVTQPDRPAGRSGKIQPPPVKVAALQYGLRVLQPETLRDEGAQEQLASLQPDVGVLFAYAQILPRAILRIPRAGILNVHPSLLPKLRGPSPVASAIMLGERETGVSLIKLVPRMDAGPIVAQAAVRLLPRATHPDVTADLARCGGELVAAHLEPWVRGQIEPRPQDESRATYCKLLTRDDGRLDWSLAAVELDRHVRALQPWPGTFTTLHGRNLRILKARAIPAEDVGYPGTVLRASPIGTGAIAVATGDGVLLLDEIQIEGRRPVEAAIFVRGAARLLGAVLGNG